jgi:hypothetical protein
MKRDPRQLDLFAPSPSKGEGPPPASTRAAPMPDRRTLEDARHDLRHFQIMQLWPGQSAERLDVLQRWKAAEGRSIKPRPSGVAPRREGLPGPGD